MTQKATENASYTAFRRGLKQQKNINNLLSVIFSWNGFTVGIKNRIAWKAKMQQMYVIFIIRAKIRIVEFV